MSHGSTTKIPPTEESQASPPDSLFYEWTTRTRKSKTNVLPIYRFYQYAKSDALSQFTWIKPERCKYMSMHPKSPINMGENFMKGIYDTLRSSPQWNQTLLIITWDEHGGFGDHVPPPTGIPTGDKLVYTEKSPDGKKYAFHFDRLGVRVTTILISPWVERASFRTDPSRAILILYIHPSSSSCLGSGDLTA